MKRTIATQQFEYEVIPASSRVPRHRQKLMIVLHGRGDSLKAFRTIDEEFRLPQMNYLLLNAPRQYDGGYTWYAFPPNQRNGILKARHKLTALMFELELQGWSSRDIFFYGFSQGCLVSCDFGMNWPKPLGGIIGISGYIYLFEDWKRMLPAAAFHTPWLITHGLYDDAIDIREAREGVVQLQSVGLPVQWVEFEKDHEIEMDEEVPFLRRWVRRRIEQENANPLILPVDGPRSRKDSGDVRIQ